LYNRPVVEGSDSLELSPPVTPVVPVRARIFPLTLPHVFYGWWIVIVSGVCQAVVGGLFSTGMSTYFLPVSRDLSLSRAALSFVFTLRSLESGLNGPWVGYLVDRLGCPFMIRAGCTLAGIGFIVLAFTQTYLAFLLVFVLLLGFGVSSGVNHPFMALINHWFARRRGLALTLSYSGTEIGGAFLTPLVGLMVLNAGWRPTAILSGILIPLIVVPLSLLLRNSPESMGLERDGGPVQTPGAVRTADGPEFAVGEAMHTFAFWNLAIAMGVRLFAKTGLSVHLVPLMVWKGLDEPSAALMVGLFALAQVPLRIGAGWVSDRWSRTKVPAVASVAGIGAVLVLLFGPSGTIWTAVAFVLLFAVAESGNLVGWSLIGDFFGRSKFASLRGIMSTIHSPLSLVAPTFMGWVFDQTLSYHAALLPILGFYGLACGLYMFLRPPRVRQAA
jgi:sugar phosphate permease